ncbi:MAG: glycoside hydrolase family 13 protein, partial [Oscillospiraceae bacterium]
MNQHAILHTQKSNYAFAYDRDTLYIRIRTAKNDMDNVSLIYGDKYEWEKRNMQSMVKVATDELFDYYETNVSLVQKRYVYIFELEKENQKAIYSENGLTVDFDYERGYLYQFQFPFINETDLHVVPQWAKSAIFYQIFPERFCNGDASRNPSNICNWNDKPKSDSFYGGDLQGIIQNLDYIKDLGITAVYLTPIFISPTNHKYDTIDYMEIDPSFGSKEDLKILVTKLHQMNIKIVFDAVFNHSGSDFFAWKDVVKHGRNSKYAPWYHLLEDSVKTNPINYRAFAFCTNMPKLNTYNPEVRAYLLEVAKYWITEFDIDGWRLDVSDEIDHDFWRIFRKVVKSAKSDAIIIGENWHDSFAWLQGDQFDSVMNYAITNTCINFFAEDALTSMKFAQRIASILMRNTKQVNEVMLNLLDSHDTARFLTLCKGDKNRAKNAITFILTFLGIPCIYYGSEIGIEGGGDPDCRRTFNWNQSSWDMDLLSYYKKLISIRKNNDLFTSGDFHITAVEDMVIMERKNKDEMIICVINNTNSSKKLQYST